MDNSTVSSVKRRKATKKGKPKKNLPLKVVYISNPMMVKTSASEFRALVQELTGQDAEFPDPAKFADADDDVGSNQTVPDAAKNMEENGVPEVPTIVMDPVHEEQQPEMGEDETKFEGFDDVFMPQLLENLTGVFQPAAAPGLYFESAAHADVLRSLGAM